MEEALFEITEIITMIKGENYDRLFKTKGKVLIKEGWMKLYDDKIKEELLPSISKGEQVEVKGLKIQQKSTKAPAHLTEKTLLKAMETCGKNTSDKEEEAGEEVLKGYSIGTAATRADTIKKLKEAKYMYTKGKSILITEKLLQLDCIKNAQTIMLYLDFNNEVATDNLIKKLIKLGKIVASPITLKEERKLIPSQITDLENGIKYGAYNIREPKPECSPAIDIKDLDV